MKKSIVYKLWFVLPQTQNRMELSFPWRNTNTTQRCRRSLSARTQIRCERRTPFPNGLQRLAEHLGRRSVAQHPPRPGVEHVLDPSDLTRVNLAQVLFLRKELPHQTVCVLIQSPLPWTSCLLSSKNFMYRANSFFLNSSLFFSSQISCQSDLFYAAAC